MARSRTGRWVPWLWWTLVLAAALAALALAWRNNALVQPWETAIGVLSVLVYATPGALVVSRQRQNRIGWIFLGVAGILALQLLLAQYAIFDLRTLERQSAWGLASAWAQSWISIPAFIFVSLFVVLYPDGRLPGRIWLLPLLGGAGFWVLLIAGAMFLPGQLAFHPIWAGDAIMLLRRNPLAVAIEPLTLVGDIIWAGGFLLFVVTLSAPLFRYRRSRAIARQQLRWLMFLTVAIIAEYLVVIIAEEISVGLPFFLEPLLVLLIGFPLAVSMAILRHNLYGLDVVINRTLVYGALTFALALVYLAMVVLLQLILPQRTALATVLSTLAVAALFNPLRSRLQAAIDRRFYRSKYDAAVALASFAAHARDEVVLEPLVQAMSLVVRDTVQPQTLSLWLRGDNARRPRG